MCVPAATVSPFPSHALNLKPKKWALLQLDPTIGAVVIGWDPAFSYTKVCYASACLRELPGCHFVATNLDSADTMGASQGQGGRTGCGSHAGIGPLDAAQGAVGAMGAEGLLWLHSWAWLAVLACLPRLTAFPAPRLQATAGSCPAPAAAFTRWRRQRSGGSGSW